MKTNLELFEYLQKNQAESILPWLKKPWKGKDKQESLLRLFAGFGLLTKLEGFNICKGNFNNQTIKEMESFREIFFDEKNKEICLKDNGDSSDLTGISKENNKKILVTTSKNLNKENIGKLDIHQIHDILNEKYKDYEMILCICIRDKKKFEEMLKRSQKSSKLLLSYIKKETTIIIDWKDLDEGYHQFNLYFKNKILKDILNINKEPLCLKFHQELSVIKTLKMKESGEERILWGHIQRSGKSYIIGGCIIKDSNEKEKCNYLVITTAPNETIEQQIKVFNCCQLNDFNIIVLNGSNKEPELSNKNIIICSKQFLQSKLDDKKKTKSIKWLKKLKFDMRFIDESHNGGTTELAQKTLDFYGKESFTVQITATYSKPVNDYKIQKKNWILWDIEDIKLFKNINKKENLLRLIQKHGIELKKLITKYSQDNIISEYSKYPELRFLTDEIKPEIIDVAKSKTSENNYGWSIESIFILKQKVIKDEKTGNNIIEYREEFQNEKEVLKVFYKIFGKEEELGIPCDEYKNNFMTRAKKICHNLSSRVIGEGDFHNEPMIIMAYLPQNNIYKISKATIKLLIKHNVIPDFEIIAINCKTTNNPKQSIEDARIKARNSGKKGVLVLSGKQCSLGVSIDNCDIVLLLNNSNSFDMINQMMFRCMTEGKNKKCGFVVDLNIHRAIETIMNYATVIRPDLHPREALKYLIEGKLLNLNSDHWMPSFGNEKKMIDKLVENCYEIYSSQPLKVLSNNLNRLKYKNITISTEDQKKLDTYFNFTKSSSNKKITSIKDKIIKDGKECKQIKDIKSTNKEKELEEQNINYMEILRHLIPLVCILTLDNTETSFDKMIKSLEKTPYNFKILLEQMKSWWGKKIDNKIFKILLKIYNNNMADNIEIKQITRTIKELFIKNKNNHKLLGQLIDEYLIPQELEKKSNAEVSTPYILRQEMLDKIPIEFWKGKKEKKKRTGINYRIYPKVLEPCCGKGGFIVDIVERFMIALEPYIKDKEERYRTIVEEILYFSDINPTNIFICKLLLDPDNKYKLNYNEGNTLELDIKEIWKINGFDCVIGNPPYNSSGNTGTGNTIWQDFTKLSLNKLLKIKGYLLFVHPPGWRKPCYKKSQLNGLFKLMCKDNKMIYLSIHDITDGKKTFKCGTKYDWYLIEKNNNNDKKTLIRDEKNNMIKINLNKLDWLPNYNIKEIIKLIDTTGNNNLNVIMDSSYHATRDYVNDTQNNEYKYPLIHSTPKSNIRYKYSKVNDKGHFGIKKVIFGEAGINHVVVDIKGKYGMTQGAMAIVVENKKEAENIKKALLSDKFKSILKSCMWGNFRIDWRLFTYFKKDFWKKFI